MIAGRTGPFVGAGALTLAVLLLAGCSAGSDAAPPGSDPAAAATTARPAASEAEAAPTTATTDATTTTVVTTTTTTTEPAPEGRDESCVATVEAGDSLAAVAAAVDGVTLDAFLEENRLRVSSVIHPGDELDVCIGNDVDDVTGASLLPPSPDAVRRQQEKLNELFAPYMIADLVVDGDSGPMTRQMLCAARMGLGLRADTRDMSEGSPEEETLLAAESLSVPAGAATWSNRWILIDKTCQVVFAGEGDDRIVDVYPTSTGEPGAETRDVAGVRAFRFDPALDNGGWHDSSHFPVSVDDPRNGNMYKPLYFSRGQAIHGADYVPPTPNSKGCARLFTWHHDDLLAWLGLDGLRSATWRPGEIGVTVSVQGDYRPGD